MHEIETHDNLVLTGKPAWHGLGTVVEQAPTPTEALQLAGLDWTVQQWPMVATSPGDDLLDVDEIDVPGHVLNVRSDTHQPLGVVGDGYKPVQNRELADFAEALAEAGDVVRVESAGSIRNGQRVWFLLRGESFSVRGDDVMHPYICLSNGHDGSAAMRATPTTVRVVCSNTLHMVIPRSESRRTFKQAVFAVRHSGDIKSKVNQAKQALQLYGRGLEATRGLASTLAARDVTRDEIQSFWLDVYQHIQAPVPKNPKTAGEKAQRTRAMEAMQSMAERFDRERSVAGSNAWNALNAFTGWTQHDRNVQGKTDAARTEQRVKNRLLGNAATQTHQALQLAAGAFL